MPAVVQQSHVAVLLLFTLWSASAVAESETLEFHHGVSQIPNYELKYPRHFAHFDYVNLDALVESALDATDLDQFVASVRALDRVLLWNYYQFPLDARGDDRIVYWNKFGRPELPDEMLSAPFPRSPHCR